MSSCHLVLRRPGAWSLIPPLFSHTDSPTLFLPRLHLLRQLRSSGDDILASFWGTVGGATQQLLEEGSTFLETKNRMRKWAGISNQLGEHVDDLWNAVDLLTWCMINAALAVILWSGPFVVEITVITSFLLLLKMLSYLRGFDDCGWLLVVLYAQFKGAQG